MRNSAHSCCTRRLHCSKRSTYRSGAPSPRGPPCRHATIEPQRFDREWKLYTAHTNAEADASAARWSAFGQGQGARGVARARRRCRRRSACAETRWPSAGARCRAQAQRACATMCAACKRGARLSDARCARYAGHQTVTIETHRRNVCACVHVRARAWARPPARTVHTRMRAWITLVHRQP